MKNTTQAIVPAVDRVLNVLEYVVQRKAPVCVKEITQDLDIPNTSAFRLVKQLAARGYLEETPERPGYYRLGLQVLTLSNGVTQVNDLRQTAHHEMDKLTEVSGQVAQLGILKGNEITYIEQILPPNPVLLYTVPYSVLPLNISACGKVMAAFSSEEKRQNMLKDAHFEKQTPNTIVDVDAYMEHLELVRKQGYAEDNEEFSVGVGCLAAPVFNYESRCVAALGITGGVQNYRGENKEKMLRYLLECTHNISVKLGMSAV